MTQDSNAPTVIEQAVSRALRDNLERIQRTSDELHQAVADVVSACASSNPGNALPPMLRAQTTAASLAAALEVLSRFVAMALQPGPRSAFEAQIQAEVTRITAPSVTQPVPAEPKAPVEPPPPPLKAAEPSYTEVPAEVRTEAPLEPATEPQPDAAPQVTQENIPAVPAEPEYEAEFNVSRLSTEEQELHRRANRVAKVSMQDIKMLRPEQVRLGRENKDICIRLKDDIEKAHREYDRRFKPIMDHPIDYFYRWMVEILAEGDAHALGEYPYATQARHH
jgi:hypothetical protein